MKRGLPFLSWLGLAGALGAIAAIAIGWQLTGGAIAMPGPLNAENDGELHHGKRDHAELDCGSCHTGIGGGAMSARCLACHDDTRAEIASSSPLHGRLPSVSACLDCHTEHVHGEITRVDRATFPHDASGFALSAHKKTRDGAPFRCEDCHTTNLLDFAEDRCSECHKDDPANFLAKHTAAYGDTCRDCHDGVDRFGKGRFDHATTHFALDGKHAKTTCEGCHRGAHDLPGFATAPTRCYGCHQKDDAHHGDNGEECGKCHTTTAWKPAKGDEDASSTEPAPPSTPSTPTSHPTPRPPRPPDEQAPANHRFPLDHGGGGRVACATCHPNGNDTYTCFGCHEHTPNNIARIHDRAGVDDTSDCAHCHPTGRPARR